jgi:hypothetical protein
MAIMTWDEEERRAWDLYTAALIGNGGRFADVAVDADKLLEERRKRFPKPDVAPTTNVDGATWSADPI